MAAATHKLSQTLFIIVFIISHMPTYLLAFPHIHLPDILDASQSFCVVLVPEELLTRPEKKVIYDVADVAFVNDSSVMFGVISELPSSWPNGKRVKFVGDPLLADLQESVFLVKRQKKDRICLLTSINNLISPDILHHKVLTESESGDVIHIVNHLLEFINHNCETFRSADGSLNIRGQHRQEILHNLYSPKRSRDFRPHDQSHPVMLEHASSTYSAETNKLQKDDLFCRVENMHEDEIACSKHHVKNHDNTDLSQTETCEKIDIPSFQEFFQEYLSRSKPVVIKGATKEWKAFKKWTKEFLRENYGEKEVHIKLTPDGNYEGVEPIVFWEDYKDFKIPTVVREQLPYPDLVVVRPASTEILFSDFLDLIGNVSTGELKNISAYLEYSSIASYFPELNEDITEMPFFQNILNLEHVNIWLSDGSTLGKLHFDPYDNFLCQISGKKQVLLFEPHDNTRLYEGHIQEAQLSYNPTNRNFSRKKLLDGTAMVMSPVDPLKPDLQRFPKFADVKPLNCTISAGEVLFMPAFWWHEVQSKPNETEHRNLAVNFWYEPFLTREFPCPECRLDVNPKYFHLL